MTFEGKLNYCFTAFGKLVEMVPNQEAIYTVLRRGCKTQQELDAVECFESATRR